MATMRMNLEQDVRSTSTVTAELALTEASSSTSINKVTLIRRHNFQSSDVDFSLEDYSSRPVDPTYTCPATSAGHVLTISNVPHHLPTVAPIVASSHPRLETSLAQAPGRHLWIVPTCSELNATSDMSEGSTCGLNVNSEEEVHVKFFPEELLEKIMSKVLFPSLFKVRILSRKWYFKLPCSSPVMDCLLSSSLSRHSSLSPTPFQVQITSGSYKWSVYCSIYLNMKSGVMVGFDHVSSRWKTLMSISYVPSIETLCHIACAGSLIFIMRQINCVHTRWSSELEASVTNPLTGAWRTLPNCYYEGEVQSVKIKLLTSSNAYKVVVLLYGSNPPGGVQIQVYDSSSEQQIWTVTISRPPDIVGVLYRNSCAYLDGKLYCICRCIRDFTGLPTLCVYHQEKDSWVQSPSSFNMRLFGNIAIGVLLCGTKLMVVTICETDGVYRTQEWIAKCPALATAPDMFLFHEFNIDSLTLVNTHRPPPEIEAMLSSKSGVKSEMLRFACNANFIYVHQIIEGVLPVQELNTMGNKILTFNVKTHKWTCLVPPHSESELRDEETWRWLGITFQPGLNPFMNV